MLLLKGQLDVQKRRHRLHRAGVLCVVKKVPDTGLELSMPFKDVELGVRKRLRAGIVSSFLYTLLSHGDGARMMDVRPGSMEDRGPGVRRELYLSLWEKGPAPVTWICHGLVRRWDSNMVCVLV